MCFSIKTIPNMKNPAKYKDAIFWSYNDACRLETAIASPVTNHCMKIVSQLLVYKINSMNLALQIVWYRCFCSVAFNFPWTLPQDHVRFKQLRIHTTITFYSLNS